MSSFYSQNLQYKLQSGGAQQLNYLHQTTNSNSNSSSSSSSRASNNNNSNNKRLNNSKSNNGGINGNIRNTNDGNMTTYLSTKRMATSNNKSGPTTTTTYIVQKLSGSSTTNCTYVTSNDVPTQSIKINTHLLDHGYGATPQPSFNVSNNDDSTGFKGYTKSSDGGITSYYKVCLCVYGIANKEKK